MCVGVYVGVCGSVLRVCVRCVRDVRGFSLAVQSNLIFMRLK